MTLFLSEGQVEGLLEMKEVVASVEEAFRREAQGEAVNSARTRSRAPGAVLNVMHANLSYLGRGGVKCYMSSPRGTRFVFVLFDMKDSAPLAVMGAEILGRYRTGATSGVATKYLYGRGSANLAVFGSGRQAITQVMAVAAVTSVAKVMVWSPNREHREEFVEKLRGMGLDAYSSETPDAALRGADVASAITSSKLPFLGRENLAGVSHVNVCGGNNPDQSEVTAEAVGTFGTVVVDDLPQARVEYGDLIQAVEAGLFSWDSAVELRRVVGGEVSPRGRTLFKSGGAALEDVAVASALYDKARGSAAFSSNEFDLG